MALARAFLARLRAAVRAPELDRDFQQEFDTHLAMLTDDYVRSGMSADDAARAARIRLGQAEALKAAHRDARGLPALDSLWQDDLPFA